MLAGGWSSYSSDITTEQQAVLATALEGIVGAKYQPIGIQQQVVAGLNYCFFCIGTLVTAQGSSYMSKVNVYVDTEQKVTLQSIDVVHPG